MVIVKISMEILGIGTDIIEIERIARVMEENSRFGEKIFTKTELNYCLGKRSCGSHLAARFAAKEAVAKAIGKSLSWQDVEMINGNNGKPSIRLYGEAKRLTEGCQVLITVSHSQNYATATALLVKL